MKSILGILSIIATTFVHNAYANQDLISSCPDVSQLDQKLERVYHTRFYGVNNAGELFTAKDAHSTKIGYIFAYYSAKSFNKDLSRYDENSNKLICVYDIEMYDASSGDYVATLQDYMTK